MGKKMFDSYRFENVANSFFDHLYHRVLTRFDLLILIISPFDQLAFHWNPISENYNLNISSAMLHKMAYWK